MFGRKPSIDAARHQPQPQIRTPHATMKSFSSAAFLLAASLSAPTLSAQNPTPVAPPPPPPAIPAHPALVAPPAEPAPPEDAAPGLVPQIADHVGLLLKDATRSANDAMRSALKSAQASLVFDADSPAFQFGAGARSSSRSLVIQATTPGPGRVDEIEEDLSVMARILQKAARSLREDDRFNAMGIDVDSSVFGSASGARNLYIEGHGAIFLLSVKYPLVGPPESSAADRTASPPDTEWERTREEVLGSSEHEGTVVTRSSRTKAEPFDEKKVAGLKLALLNALTNASNIRHLAPAEFVSIVVQGGDVAEMPVARVEYRGRKESRSNGDGSKKSSTSYAMASTKSESVMSLRAKKADLDALAAGQITPEQFRQRASVATYLRRSESGRAGRR